MNIKIWLYCTILIIQRIFPSETISIHSIVRLKCNFCKPEPDKCCVGTVILPNFILTTAYCADLCQSIIRGNQVIDIVKKYIHTNYKNFVMLEHYVERNDIALLYFETNVKHYYRYVKLSAVEVTSAIGRLALVPVLDNNKTHLQVTIIKKCEALTGNYVCSIRKVPDKHQKSCHYEQGIPLLFRERVIGITSLMGKEECQLPQRSFVPVGPASDWIRSITHNFILNNHPVLRMGKPINSLPAEDSPVLRSNSYEVNATLLPKEMNNTSAENINKTYTETKNTTRFDLMTTSTVIWSNDTLNIEVSKSNSNKISKFLSKNHTSNYNMTIYTKSSQLLLSSVRKMITKSLKKIIPVTTKILSKRAFKKLTAITANLRFLTTTTAASVEPNPMKPTTTKSQNISTTSVMDWFNKKFKQKLLKSPAPILVLTKTTRAIEFLDLT